MNYLAHFFVDEKSNNPFYNTGLILPDLCRGYIKSFKLIQPDVSNLTLYSLHQGCMAHYYADKKFHASTFFENTLQLVLNLINKAPFSTQLKRKWFLAHVMTELLLDRILIKSNPTLVDRFYSNLQNCSLKDLRVFLMLYDIKELDNFIRHFNHFVGVAYIQFYPNNIKFVFSLNRIMMKAGVGPIVAADELVLLTIIDEAEAIVLHEVKAINEDLKRVIHE